MIRDMKMLIKVIQTQMFILYSFCLSFLFCFAVVTFSNSSRDMHKMRIIRTFCCIWIVFMHSKTRYNETSNDSEQSILVWDNLSMVNKKWAIVKVEPFSHNKSQTLECIVFFASAFFSLLPKQKWNRWQNINFEWKFHQQRVSTFFWDALKIWIYLIKAKWEVIF